MKSLILNYIFGDCDKTLFNEKDRDNCCEPYLFCRAFFAQRSADFVSSKGKKLDDTKWIIFWDASSIAPTGLIGRSVFWAKNALLDGDMRDLFRRKIPKAKRALIMHEPLCVCPQNWDMSLHRRFDCILTWDPSLCTSAKYVRFCLPHGGLRKVCPAINFNEKKLICDISNNKIHRFLPNNAKKRFELIQFFSRKVPDEFDLYGSGWNPSVRYYLYRYLRGRRIFYTKVSTWRGPAHSKAETLSKYKFTLCVENSSDSRGYVSNKIFDAMQSGCIPVYLGPPDRYDYFPRGTFIDLADFENYDRLLQHLVSMDSMTHAQMLANIDIYLSSAAHEQFTKEVFSKTLYNALMPEDCVT